MKPHSFFAVLTVLVFSCAGSCIVFSNNGLAAEAPTPETEPGAASGAKHEEHHESEEGPRWEFSGGTNAALIHTFGLSGSNAPTLISVNTTADYFLTPYLEMGLLGLFNDTIASGIPSIYGVTLAAGPTFNFLGADADHSFLLEARAGVLISGQNTYNAKSFNYLVGFGHRFEIVHHVSWRPEVYFVGNNSASSNGVYVPATQQLQFFPFQFSLSF